MWKRRWSPIKRLYKVFSSSLGISLHRILLVATTKFNHRAIEPHTLEPHVGFLEEFDHTLSSRISQLDTPYNLIPTTMLFQWTPMGGFPWPPSYRTHVIMVQFHMWKHHRYSFKTSKFFSYSLKLHLEFYKCGITNNFDVLQQGLWATSMYFWILDNSHAIFIGINNLLRINLRELGSLGWYN